MFHLLRYQAPCAPPRKNRHTRLLPLSFPALGRVVEGGMLLTQTRTPYHASPTPHPNSIPSRPSYPPSLHLLKGRDAGRRLSSAAAAVGANTSAIEVLPGPALRLCRLARLVCRVTVTGPCRARRPPASRPSRGHRDRTHHGLGAWTDQARPGAAGTISVMKQAACLYRNDSVELVWVGRGAAHHDSGPLRRI